MNSTIVHAGRCCLGNSRYHFWPMKANLPNTKFNEGGMVTNDISNPKVLQRAQFISFEQIILKNCKSYNQLGKAEYYWY